MTLPFVPPSRPRTHTPSKPAPLCAAAAEDALVKAGALQKAIFDSANFSSIATDANGVIQIFNVGAERMLGYTAAEVMNKITPADISDPDEVITRAKTLSAELDTPITPGFEALVFKARRGIEDIYELTYIRKDGSRFPAVVSVTALRDARDAIIGYLLIGTDNTARKQAAQLLEAVNEELRQFVSVASHDLRQPLRMVTSYLNLIEKRLPPQSLTDDIKEFLGYAVGGAKRMDSMILGLLEYSSTGKSAAMVPVPLADAVADALSNLTLAIREADAEIVVVEGLPTVTGNMTELTRLFQNLIGNAVKYHAPGRSPKIEIDWSRTGSDWLILIKDNGIGIAPEDRERAFGIFQRLVTQDAYEGTGIGLAVCKKIVEHHNGRIWIESALNEGTTFFLALRNGSAAP
ncbi:MAG: PAS domain S-box protein [Rhodospirillaceae bacterium]|nr:PAS domain S-box protein [Rhodospirillales bacterium]